jgi:hypothetical protein
MMTWLLAVAAAAVALWPTGKKAAPSAYVPSTLEIDPPKRQTTYLDAVACLQKVRSRLVHTDLLDDSVAEALSTLTLALQHGSDVEE